MKNTSLLLIETEINRFLSSKEPEIICIKGRWGVGKTYAWRKFLKKAQAENGIGNKKYSYISLFGRNSLADLRNAVTENTVSTDDVEAKPSLKTIENAASILRQSINKSGFIASLLPQSSGYAQLGQRMLYLFVRNTIVCLDDLERAGSGLNMKDVLGLASQLKDEKDCKVIILLNDEKLSEDAKNDFQDQLEKVADITINFELSPEEAADIAIDDQKLYSKNLRENCIKLKIDNIRVIKKAEQFSSRLIALLSNFDPRLVHQAIHTTTLACYAKYQPSKAPSISSIRSFSQWDESVRYLNGDKSKPNPDYTLIQEYGFTSVDAFDEIIIDTVERGYLSESQLLVEASKINDNLRTGDMKNDYFKVWEKYRSSFARDEDDLADSMSDAVIRNITIVDPPNLDSVVSILREMGFNDKASGLIKFYMNNKNEQNRHYWDPNAFEYHGRIRDKELHAALHARHRLIDIDVDPIETLKKLSDRNGWNEEDEILILQLSEEDVTNIFMTFSGEDFTSIISTYRSFFTIMNPSPNITEICRRAKIALNKVVASSNLNKIRVKSLFHGIDI
ncbi:hypothetical protein [Methylobacterium sp. WL8]|uniref:hypothetical protein n=1 Tax=Methylobacterium sp. WL8 TaxID=2603899 RepID=UPI0011C7AE9B|nr:hypothetical protein [Methylobacterium sp. WL8]TXN80044.1 hypothetical protein FV234_18335 [Methylobacterium sp. WL8]